jgi:hypothetical protein
VKILYLEECEFYSKRSGDRVIPCEHICLFQKLRRNVFNTKRPAAITHWPPTLMGAGFRKFVMVICDPNPDHVLPPLPCLGCSVGIFEQQTHPRHDS